MRKTKIIATLGPAVAGIEPITEMIAAGMDVARLNFSHGDHEGHRRYYDWVRRAADDLRRPVAILQDIQGPRIRVGTFPEGGIKLENDAEIDLVPGEGMGSDRQIAIENLDRALLEPGSRVVLSDGMIALTVTTQHGDVWRAKVVEGGDLTDHKGVAFPGCLVDVPAVSAKDQADLDFGQELGVDYVAASFVSSGADVRRVKELVGGTPVIAKIESVVGYANLDDILEEAYGTMVARGDLGVELSFARIPRAQKDILTRSNAKARISITATEMLESMVKSRRPTRAEVTDVSTAVLDGSDAVMLSAETAVGDYPIRTVQAMALICEEAEASPGYGRGPEIEFLEDAARFASATAQASVDAATNLGLGTIVAFTESGSTARLISKYRPQADVYAFTPHVGTYRRMALYAGVTPLRFTMVESTDEMVTYAEEHLIEEGIAGPGDGFVLVAGIPPNQSATTNLMKLHSVGQSTSGVPGA